MKVNSGSAAFLKEVIINYVRSFQMVDYKAEES